MTNRFRNLAWTALVGVPFALLSQGCAPECVDKADCADKGANYTCVDNVCVVGNPTGDAGMGGGGGSMGGGGGTTGGGGGTTGGGGGTTGGGGGSMGGGGGSDDAGTGGGGGGDDAGTGGGGGSDDAGTDAGMDMDAGTGGGGGSDDAGTDAGMDPDAGTDAGTMPAGLFAVLVVGPAADGGSINNSAGAALRVELRDFSGAVQATVPLPTANNGAQRSIVLRGNSGTEGSLALAGDRGSVTLAGFNTTPGQANAHSTAGIARVVARVGFDGGVDTSTVVDDGFLGDSVRGAVTNDGTGYWVAGTSTGGQDGGVRYVTHAGTGPSTQVFTAINNMRFAGIAGGNLYASTQSGLFSDAGITRVFQVGTGLPTSLSSATYLPGVDIDNPSNFVFLDLDTQISGVDALFVCDTGNGRGVKRYHYNGTSWTLVTNYLLPANVACLFAAVSPDASTVLATAGTTTSPSIYKWVGTYGDLDAGVGTTLSASPTGAAFRGLVIP